MNGITTQIDKLIKQINETLVKPIQQPSLHLFDFNYYTFSHKVFNLAFVILEHAEIPKQERAAYEKLVKKMKQAAKCRPQDESDESDSREGKDEITAFLNTRRAFPQTKERGQLYKFLAMREQKEKDTKSFLENINKINLRVVPKQKKIERVEYAQTYVQTGITWVRKLESIQSSQTCVNIQQLKDQLFGKKETRIKINVDQQNEGKKQMRKTFQSKKTISEKGSAKKIEKNKKTETKKVNKDPLEQDQHRINIVSEHGSGNKSKSIIRKHKMAKKQNRSEADELNNTNNRDISFTSKLYKQHDQITNREKLIDPNTDQIELESQESYSLDQDQKNNIYREKQQSKLRTQRKSLLKCQKSQKGQYIERQKKSRQMIYLEQQKVNESKPTEGKQIRQGTIDKNQEEEIKQFQVQNKNRSNSNYIDNTFYNDRILQKNSNLSNLSTHTHTHGLYSDKSTMKQRLPYIKDNIKNKEKKEKQRMVERYLRNSGFRNENMTSCYVESKQREEKENKEFKDSREFKEYKENKEKMKKQNQMSQLGQVQNSEMHRGLQSIKERMKSLLNQKIIQKKQLSQNDKYVMNTLQKLKNQKTTNNSYLEINEIREINQTNQSKINPMYNEKINQCIKLMENIHQKACGKSGCKHLQRFLEFVKVFRFQNKKSIKLPTYNIGIVPVLNSK